MIRRVARTVLTAPLAGVAVVVNVNQSEVAHSLHSLPLTLLENRRAEEGMATSLHMGVEFLLQGSATAGVLLLGDQPGLTSIAIAAVVGAFQATGAALVQAVYEDGAGHPILFARELFTELMEVSGDEGGRSVVRRHREQVLRVSVPGGRPQDVDTQADYEALWRGFDRWI